MFKEKFRKVKEIFAYADVLEEKVESLLLEKFGRHHDLTWMRFTYPLNGYSWTLIDGSDFVAEIFLNTQKGLTDVTFIISSVVMGRLTLYRTPYPRCLNYDNLPTVLANHIFLRTLILPHVDPVVKHPLIIPHYSIDVFSERTVHILWLYHNGLGVDYIFEITDSALTYRFPQVSDTVSFFKTDKLVFDFQKSLSPFQIVQI